MSDPRDPRQGLGTAEERLRAVQELSLDAFSFLEAVRDDRGTIVDFRWEYVNPAAARILHAVPEELIGRRVLEVLPPGGSSDEVFRRLAEVVETGVSYDMEVSYDSDGETGWFRNAAVKMGNGIAVYYSDITERKRAEDKLRRNERRYRKLARKLKELNETLEQRVAQRTTEADQRAALIRTLAWKLAQTEHRERRRLAQVLHDHLQQLLVAAKLKITLLKRQSAAAELSPPLTQTQELLDQAIEASRSLTVELCPPVLYDAGLLEALQWLAREMRQRHGLEVEVQGDPRAEPATEDIKIVLFQSVREFLFNVVKHAQCHRARVAMSRRDPDEVQITVSDDGVGFTPDRMEVSETGLASYGLWSIRDRLEWMNGHFEVESAPDRGTRITIALPRRRATGQGSDAGASRGRAKRLAATGHRAAPRGSSSTTTKKTRVLLADDHELLREGLAGLLRELPDVEVVGEARDGLMALTLALQLRPDVVMMDVVMPRLGGIEATRRIKAQLPEVRVVGLSMHEEPEMAEAMLEAGASEYLRKDCPSEALIAAIRKSDG